MQQTCFSDVLNSSYYSCAESLAQQNTLPQLSQLVCKRRKFFFFFHTNGSPFSCAQSLAQQNMLPQLRQLICKCRTIVFRRDNEIPSHMTASGDCIAGHITHGFARLRVTSATLQLKRKSCNDMHTESFQHWANQSLASRSGPTLPPFRCQCSGFQF